MKDFFTLFASVKIIKIGSELISYFIRSTIKYWLAFCLTGIFVFIIIYKYLQVSFPQHYFLIVGLGIFISALPGFIFNLKKKFTVRKYNISENNILISDFLLIKENQYINLDIESEQIRLKLIPEFKKINENYYPFVSHLCETEIIHHPKLFYLMKNVGSIKKSFYDEVENNKAIALLMISKNELSKKIEFDVILKQGFHFDLVNDVINTFSNLSILNEGFNKDYIIGVAKIFVSMIAYGSLNLFDLELQHSILDDNKKIIMSAVDIIINKIKPEPLDEIVNFKNKYDCEFERTKGLILLKQKEFHGALNHIFNAIRINPFFPFNTYHDFKEEYTMKNVLKFSSLKLALGKSE
jgi:hypothetical protein